MSEEAKGCPEDMRWVNPYLFVEDVETAMQFYINAFGFQKRYTYTGPEGKINHCELAHNDSVIMVGVEFPSRGAPSPKQLGGSPLQLYVYFEDVDKIFDRAVRVGAKAIVQPTDILGDRAGLVEDPFGHRWHLATSKRYLDKKKEAEKNEG